MKNLLNSKMLFLIFQKLISKQKLDSSLKKLLSTGFIISNNCFFLKCLFENQKHIKESDFIDKVGYECFINSIHIDDYVQNNLFEQSILFAEKLINLWNAQNSGKNLKIILVETYFGFNLKFHIERENEEWIDENELNNFKEGIIIINIPRSHKCSDG